ncbi:MAG TPA: Xaa-Pro peptidase family protein [Methanospirillum sp.]|uniref:M24 family metallopeptidase n=1 Tax=Methanospirillum sp. TaxID=45200 RepID=UPI002CE0A692|nr:Xaa-Pro peptidase family protein [Methanospirillum sp.]HOJ97258.1 Xaa-Pro peptidase family protein [Methanospirillum sp.]HPP77890.1 Xaa-Pro peptidase family protein [Methanospirillum sp.]
MDSLDDLIRDAGAAAYCLYASSDNAAMRHMTRFVTHDPVTILKRIDKPPLMIVPQMEADRALRESLADVLTRQQAGYLEIFEHEKDPWKIQAEMIHRLCAGPYLVPPDFPTALTRALESYDTVYVDSSSRLTAHRAIKTPEETGWIIRAQRAAEAAMDRAVSLIRYADIRSGVLWHEDSPLTSDIVRYEMNKVLLAYDCTARDTIVACGPETAMPHCTGNGELKAHAPIVIDVFPCDNKTGYHADMTRTVSRGEPAGSVSELYTAVKDALLMSERMVRDGVSGAACYQAVRDYFSDLGYRSDTEGFIHSLGHGVGLEIHEQPSLSGTGGLLHAGNVITLEPGLYYRDIGGVRIENLGIVEKSGFSRITDYPLEMVL